MNKNIWSLLIMMMIWSVNIQAKRVMFVPVEKFKFEFFKDKHWLNQKGWFKTVPLQEILQKNPQIRYQKVVDKVLFDAPEFSISPKFPHKGYFNELFILSIPQGRVQGMCGHVFVNGMLSDEMARGDRFECLVEVPNLSERTIKKVSGRVAVIAQHGAGGKWANYYHAICEVFGRLAILEMSGIEYDWLYVPLDKKFVREALQLWGVDFSKIINPTDEEFYLQADELIVPSMVINTSVGHAHAGNFQHPVTLKYVREKLLAGAKKQNIDSSKFNKRVFISRKDSYNARRILNEDEIFELFKAKGFESYEMSKFSVAEQIMLLHNAEIVVSEQGSGLTNIIFCKPNAIIVEIFQALIDNCFWWVSYAMDLKYMPIKTLEVEVDYFADFRTQDFRIMNESIGRQTDVPLDTIKKFIETVD